MSNRKLSAFHIAGLLTLGWLPFFAHATGGSFGCSSGDPFYCPFVLWNVGIGLLFLGLPGSVVLFAGLYWYLRRDGGWSKWKRVLLGAVHGFVVFEVAVFVAAMVWPWVERMNMSMPGQASAFIGTYVLLLMVSVIYLAATRDTARKI